MGYSARLVADIAGLNDEDALRLEWDGLAPHAPIHGFVLKNGRKAPFTLDIEAHSMEPHSLWPEQLAIAALVAASFVGAILHFIW